MAVISSGLNKEAWDAAQGNSQDGALFSPKPGVIEVYPSGDFVDLLKPHPDTIHLADIAHHLSMCCRYAGGISNFYSVAEHSVLVHDLIAKLINPANQPIRCVELQRAALLHDAAEAYTGDMTAPLKWSLRQHALMTGQAQTKLRDVESGFDVIAHRLDHMIGTKFGVDPELFSDPDLKLCDLWAMKLEAEALTKTGGAHWRWPGDLPQGGQRPLGIEFIGGMKPEYARTRWHARAQAFWIEEDRR